MKGATIEARKRVMNRCKSHWAEDGSCAACQFYHRPVFPIDPTDVRLRCSQSLVIGWNEARRRAVVTRHREGIDVLPAGSSAPII